MTRSIDDRVIELEIQLAHVQRLYEQLNEVVTEQALAADKMQHRVDRLQQRVSEMKNKSTEVVDPLDEKPPHY
ncbi:MAG: SlyX family protein [Rubripirellula sp.]